MGFILYTYFDFTTLSKNRNNSKADSTNLLVTPIYSVIDSRLNKCYLAHLAWTMLKVHVYKTYFINHIFVFLTTCKIFLLALDFQECVENLPINDFDNMIKLYRKLKTKLELINTFAGWHVLTFCAIVLTYYCEIPDVISGKMWEREGLGSVVFYLFLNSFLWLVAAEGHSVIHKTVKKWIDNYLFNRYNDIPKLEKVEIKQGLAKNCGNLHSLDNNHASSMEIHMMLMAIRNDLSAEPLGLSCKFFTVTHGFLTSVSLVVFMET